MKLNRGFVYRDHNTHTKLSIYSPHSLTMWADESGTNSATEIMYCDTSHTVGIHNMKNDMF